MSIENIQKKKCGSDYVVAANKTSTAYDRAIKFYYDRKIAGGGGG